MSQTYVVFIDDIFGRTNLSKDDLRMWERELATMWPLIETGQVLLLIASRGSIFKQCHHVIKSSKLFSTVKEIALNTTKYALKFEEKMCMMEAYIKQRKSLSMSHKDMCEAVRTSGDLGFPQICKFYISSREAQKRGVDFFSRPLQYLMDEIRTLRDVDPNAYIVLLLLTFNRGILKQSDLDPFSKQSLLVKEQLELLKTVWNVHSGFGLGDVWNVAERMCNVYLRDDQGSYVFSHQSIYETVILEFTSKYPRKGMEIAPVDILVEFVWIEECRQSRPTISIVLKENFYEDLAKRILEELKSKNAEKIMDHPALRNERFLQCLCDLISDDDRWDLLSKTIPSAHTEFERYSVFSNDYINWKFDGNNRRSRNSVNTDTMSLPLRELYVPSLLYVKGLQTLSSVLHPSSLNNSTVNWQMLLTSSAFVGDTVFVEQLLHYGVVPDELCVLATLVCSEDTELITRKCFNHPHAPELCMGKIEFCLKFSVHCKKPHTIQLLIDKLPMDVEKSDVLEILIKLVFIDQLSKPGLLSPFVNLPKINPEQEHSSSIAMFHVLLSAQAQWDPVKSLLLVSQSADLELLKGVFLELESLSIKHDLQADCPESPVSTNSACAKESACYSGHIVNQADKYDCTPLHHAAYGGSAACVELLLQQGANVFAMTNIKESPLHEAAKSKMECAMKIQLLLEAGADMNAKDAGSRTPLHILAMKGLLDDFRFLVKRGADVNAMDNLHQTPLHLASCLFNDESSGKIQLVVDRNARVNITDTFGSTPLIYIAEKGTVGILKYLIERGADVNVKNKLGKTALHKAAASATDSVAKMDLLLKHHCDLEEADADGWNALLGAANAGTTESIGFLIAQHCNVSAFNHRGQTALHLVSQSPFAIKDKLKCLLKSGINVNYVDDLDGSTPLHCAAGDGSVSTVEFLLENKAMVNIQDHSGLTPLHRAAQSLIEPGEKIQVLIDKGADTNIRDKDGYTPLFHAAEQGTVEGLQAFVSNNVDLTIKDYFGETVLHKAAKKYQTTPKKIQYLLPKRVDVNSIDDLGNTPLHFAALDASFLTLKCLVDSGAETDIANTDSITPLHNAVKSTINSKEKITYLIKNGANMYVTDKNGDTPLHFAADDTFEKLQLLITSLGGDITQTDKQGNSLIYIAAMSSHDIRSKILLLIEHGADINAAGKNGWNLTHWAINLGSSEDLMMMLDMGANPFVVDEDGMQVIHKAAKSRTDCVVKLEILLKRGVSINVKDTKGCTPLHVAAMLGTIDSLMFLIQKCADTSVRNDDGRTSLHLSVTSKYDSHLKVEALVESSADVNVRDKKDMTPLHNAADTGSFKTFEYLISQGSDMYAVNDCGRTPRDLAAESKVDQELKLHLILTLNQR